MADVLIRLLALAGLIWASYRFGYGVGYTHGYRDGKKR